MKEKWIQKKIDNFCVIPLLMMPLFLGGIVAAVFVPLSPKASVMSETSAKTLLLHCEEYGVFSNEKFAELEARIPIKCREGNNICFDSDSASLYNEQKTLRKICTNSSVNDVPVLIKLLDAKAKSIEYFEVLLNSNFKKLRTIKEELKEEKQKFKRHKNAFAKTSENIDKSLSWIPFDPFKQCLKNYNNLVETFAKIYDLKIE